MESNGGSGSGLERRQWVPGQWTAQGKGHTRAAAGTGGSVVSKARTGASRAPGTDAGHDKGAQGRGPGLGCWWLTVREARRGGGGGGLIELE